MFDLWYNNFKSIHLNKQNGSPSLPGGSEGSSSSTEIVALKINSTFRNNEWTTILLEK